MYVCKMNQHESTLEDWIPTNEWSAAEITARCSWGSGGFYQEEW